MRAFYSSSPPRRGDSWKFSRGLTRVTRLKSESDLICVHPRQKTLSSLRLGGLNNRRLASADGAEAGFFVFSDIRIFRVDTDASGAVAGFYFGESRDNAFAVVDGKWAARVERAAFWRIDGGGDVAC